eukprot:4917133-Prymnesium_polylepis.1
MDCSLCLHGADCAFSDFGPSLAELRVLEGFWRLSPSSPRLYRCQTGENTSACQGGIAGASICREGHAGPLCQVCLASSQYFEAGTGVCEVCPEAGDTVAIAIGVTLVLLTCGGLLYFLHEQHAENFDFVGVPLRSCVHHTRMGLRESGVMAKVKLALTFVQVIAALDSTYAIGGPTRGSNPTAVRL